MKRLLFTLFFTTATLSIVIGLKCFDCESIQSFSDCDKNRKEVTCSNSSLTDHYRCIKVHVSYTLHSKDYNNYKRGCVKREECSDNVFPLCKTAAYESNKECDINCCSTDLCNVGSNTMVSVLLLVSCVLGVLTLF